MELDRTALKVQALLERLTTVVQQYENTIADFRTEMTVQNQEIVDLTEKLSVANEELASAQSDLNNLRNDVQTEDSAAADDAS